MSKEYEGQDPLVLAQQAERDLNSYGAKQGLTDSKSGDSVNESGINTSATTKYPGATVKTGPSSSGREIAPDEGGDIISRPGEKGGQGRNTRDTDFEGEGGPETKQKLYEEANPGNDDVESNVRQKKAPKGDTVPTNFGLHAIGQDDVRRQGNM